MHRRFSLFSIFGAITLFLALLTTGATGHAAHAQTHRPALQNGLALTPPMGWNSWNHFGCNINANVIEQAADAMVNSGMKAAGYQYVNIDDCWASSRDNNGNIVADASAFPNGIKAVADYVHNDGLKLGIYTDAGTQTCAGRPGSYGHEQQDANSYASWGIDYVKEDWCNTSGLDPQTQYVIMRDALKATGRPIVFSLCDWGTNSPWVWGPNTGNLWRTTQDINDSWSSFLSNMDSSSQHAASAGPGAWNDPDMLEVGNGGMTSTEDQSEFSMWAIMAAPLITGNDLSSMSATTKSILTNSEVIAVDQDSLGSQGTKVADNGSGLQVWSKKLSADGTRAVALFNRSGSAANITVNWSDLGLSSGSASVRDLWAHQDMGSFNGSYTANVPSHGVVMLKVSGTEGSATSYEAESSANTLSGGAVVASCSNCSGGQKVGYIGNGGTLQFNNVNVGRVGDYLMTIYYVDGDAGRGASISIDGGSATSLNFPGTNDGNWNNVQSIGLVVDLTAGNNSVSFSNGSAYAPDIDRITISSTPTISPTSYYSFTNHNSGLVIDDPNSSMTNGTVLIQYSWNGGNNQQWNIISVGGGYYTLINRASDRLADVDHASTSDGANVLQWPFNSGTNQQWSIVSFGGYYKLINRNSGKVMAVNGNSTSNSATIDQTTDTGSAAQQWSIAKVS